MRITFDGATREEVENAAKGFRLEYEYEMVFGKATEKPDGDWTLEVEVIKPETEEIMF